MAEPPDVAGWLRPLGIGEILDVAIKVCRERFTAMVKVVVVVTLPVVALSALVQLSLLSESTELLPDPSAFSDPAAFPTVDLADLWAVIAGSLLVLVLTVVASQVANAASLKLVSAAYLGGVVRWQASLRFAWSRLGSLIWLTIVVMLLIGLIGAAAAIAAFAAIAAPSPVVMVLALLAAAALVVYLVVAWSVAVPVLLLEDRRGGGALKRSRRLVAGRWWPTLTVTALAYVLLVLVQIGLSALLSAVVLSGAGEVATVVGQSVVDVAAAAVTTPFLAAVTTVLYFDLRVRREGFDLDVLARRVGVEPRVGAGAGSPSPPEDLPLEPPGDAVPSAAPAYGTAQWRASSPTSSGAAEPGAGEQAFTAVPAYAPGARQSMSRPPAGAPAPGLPEVGHSAPSSSAGARDPFPYRTTASRAPPVRLSTVVAGVALGLWLFVVSLFLVGMVLGRVSLESLRGTTTTTAPPAPPTSTP